MAGDGADGGAQADVEVLEIDLEWHRALDAPIRSEAATPASSSNRRLDPRWLIGAAVLAYLLWLFGLGGDDSGGGSAAPDARTPVTTPVADERLGVGAETPLDIAADIAALTDLEKSSSYLEVMVDARIAVVREYLGDTERRKTACGCHSAHAGLNRRSNTPKRRLTAIASACEWFMQWCSSVAAATPAPRQIASA